MPDFPMGCGKRASGALVLGRVLLNGGSGTDTDVACHEIRDPIEQLRERVPDGADLCRILEACIRRRVGAR
jgi:hypothetical protein